MRIVFSVNAESNYNSNYIYIYIYKPKIAYFSLTTTKGSSMPMFSVMELLLIQTCVHAYFLYSTAPPLDIKLQSTAWYSLQETTQANPACNAVCKQWSHKRLMQMHRPPRLFEEKASVVLI